MTDQRKEVINQLHELNILDTAHQTQGDARTDRTSRRNTGMQCRSGPSWRGTATAASKIIRHGNAYA